jgi:hypothetical protein
MLTYADLGVPINNPGDGPRLQQNAAVLVGHGDALTAAKVARDNFAAKLADPLQAYSAELVERPVYVPLGWGYPERCMVTFDPEMRDYRQPRSR